MTDYRRILGVVARGRSYRDVAEMAGCSHRDVARVSQAIIEHEIVSAVAVSDADPAEWFPDGCRHEDATRGFHCELGGYRAAHRPDMEAILMRTELEINGVAVEVPTSPDNSKSADDPINIVLAGRQPDAADFALIPLT